MALSKEEIRYLIKSKSERINLCQNTQFLINHPDLHQITIDGIEMSTYIYCMMCKSLIKKFKWSTGNQSRHCTTAYHKFKHRKSQLLSEKLKREMEKDRFANSKQEKQIRIYKNYN